MSQSASATEGLARHPAFIRVDFDSRTEWSSFAAAGLLLNLAVAATALLFI